MGERCPTTGKRIYWHERLANRAITKAAERGELASMRHYLCPDCTRWHLARKHRPVASRLATTVDDKEVG